MKVIPRKVSDVKQKKKNDTHENITEHRRKNMLHWINLY